MGELNDQQISRLTSDANTGQIIRAFCQHPGFNIYKNALDAIVEDKKNIWLRGSDEDAKIERIRAQGIQKALDVLKQFILLGENSARIINNDVPLVDEK